MGQSGEAEWVIRRNRYRSTGVEADKCLGSVPAFPPGASGETGEPLDFALEDSRFLGSTGAGRSREAGGATAIAGSSEPGSFTRLSNQEPVGEVDRRERGNPTSAPTNRAIAKRAARPTSGRIGS